MRLGANSLILPLFPAFPPQNSTTPPPKWSLLSSKRQPQLPSSAWARCLGTKRSWLGSHPAWAWRHLVTRTPTHPHIPVCHQTPLRTPSVPTRQPLPAANVIAFN